MTLSELKSFPNASVMLWNELFEENQGSDEAYSMNVHESFMSEALEEARKAYARRGSTGGAVLVGAQGRSSAVGIMLPLPGAIRRPTPKFWSCVRRPGRPGTTAFREQRSMSLWNPAPCAWGQWCRRAYSGLVFGAPDPKAGALGGAVDLTKASGFQSLYRSNWWRSGG